MNNYDKQYSLNIVATQLNFRYYYALLSNITQSMTV